jgi:hypothetical protein
LLRAQPGSRVAVPLRYVGPEAVRAKFSEPELQARIKKAPVERVVWKDLVAIQHTTKAGRLESYVEKPTLVPKGSRAPGGWPIDEPIVMRLGGTSYLWDGNHRVTASILRGESGGSARVVDLDA